jgi:hypothetical protein
VPRLGVRASPKARARRPRPTVWNAAPAARRDASRHVERGAGDHGGEARGAGLPGRAGWGRCCDGSCRQRGWWYRRLTERNCTRVHVAIAWPAHILRWSVLSGLAVEPRRGGPHASVGRATAETTWFRPCNCTDDTSAIASRALPVTIAGAPVPASRAPAGTDGADHSPYGCNCTEDTHAIASRPPCVTKPAAGPRSPPTRARTRSPIVPVASERPQRVVVHPRRRLQVLLLERAARPRVRGGRALGGSRSATPLRHAEKESGPEYQARAPT